MKPRSLNHRKLRIEVDPAQLKFRTTNDIQNLREFVGQKVAIEGLKFGFRIPNDGFNLYAMGPPGTGKRSIIRAILEQELGKYTPPPDWCYIYNFDEPQKPKAISLPAGLARQLKHDMDNFIEDLQITIPVVFESDEYHARLQNISDKINKRQERLFQKIKEEAESENLTVMSTPEGFAVLPLDNKKQIISAEQLASLPIKIRKELQKKISEFTKQVTNFLKRIMNLKKDKRKMEKSLLREFTLMAVGHLVEDLRNKYSSLSMVIKFLDAVEMDVIENVKLFLKSEEDSSGSTGAAAPQTQESPGARYRINVLVDNSKTRGSPVIYEDHPTYQNLLGRIDHVAQLGMLVTDFSLINAGSLHRANGGYLIINAVKLLQHPLAWQGLKQSLYTKKIKIQEKERFSGVQSIVSLDPDPIPLKIKIVLLGDRKTHYLLSELDQDFDELFKVSVDFEDNMKRTQKNLDLYARLIATLIAKEQLLPFQNTAVAAVMDHSVRLAEDVEKLSIHIRSINDLMKEASYWAEATGHKIVQAADVKKAIHSQIRRVERVRKHYYEEIRRDTILIDTEGTKLGQVNALTVVQFGNFCFGYPSRISAVVSPGKGQVIDIEREVKMGGPLHSKGVLIITGYLHHTYLQHLNCSLYGSLVFEQSYGKIDGDSASTGELCALLSALSGLPIKQNFAITGSINQYGQVQAIGKVNEKIEGFFDICKLKGLTGKQGVIIPAANVQHLMLREDVVEMVAKKKFQIVAINTLDQAITLLTGVEAGKPNKKGQYPAGSVHARVQKRLLEFSLIRRRLKDTK